MPGDGMPDAGCSGGMMIRMEADGWRMTCRRMDGGCRRWIPAHRSPHPRSKHPSCWPVGYQQRHLKSHPGHPCSGWMPHRIPRMDVPRRDASSQDATPLGCSPCASSVALRVCGYNFIPHGLLLTMMGAAISRGWTSSEARDATMRRMGCRVCLQKVCSASDFSNSSCGPKRYQSIRVPHNLIRAQATREGLERVTPHAPPFPSPHPGERPRVRWGKHPI
jgi:hypothetical protein